MSGSWDAECGIFFSHVEDSRLGGLRSCLLEPPIACSGGFLKEAVLQIGIGLLMFATLFQYEEDAN